MLSLTVTALALGGCAGPSGPVPTTLEERNAYAQALQKLDLDRALGVAALEDFLRDSPRSGLADDAAYKLGELALELDQHEEALRWFNRVLADYPDSDRESVARLRAARLEYAHGREDVVRNLLRTLDDESLSPPARRAAFQLRARVADDPLSEVHWLISARELSNADPEIYRAIDAEITGLLGRLSDDDLARGAKRAETDAVSACLRLELISRELDAQNVEEAEDGLRRVKELELSVNALRRVAQLEGRFALLALAADRADLPTFAEALAQNRRRSSPSAGTLGVVLPLSGPFARYGEESLRGILLAAQVFDAAPVGNFSVPRDPAPKEIDSLPPVDASPDSFDPLGTESDVARLSRLEAMSGPRILVRDSGGDPARAAAAVRELAELDDVLAVIGPLLGAECESAAAVADEVGLPMLTLTSRQEVAAERENVFRIRTTPDDEVRYLVDHSFEQLDAKRFAILYPKDSYGTGMRDRFWSAIEARGGRVVAVSSYAPGDVDFAGPIRGMIGYSLLTSAEQEALRRRTQLLKRGRRLEPKVAAIVREMAYAILGPEGEPLPPRVDFDALFIPDSHDKVALIAPQLAFHDLGDVQLLGPGGWNHPDLLQIARDHVRGAVIATPFYSASHFPFVSDFVNEYEQTFEVEPDSYSAHAYDAAQIFFGLYSDGVRKRKDFRAGVLAIRGYPGVSGVFTFMPDGNARKRPFLLGVRGGRFVSLDSLN